jgi:uncharacterized protein YkwD
MSHMSTLFGRWSASLALFSGLAGCAPRPNAAAVRPTHPLELEEAREYVMALVNRDRAESGLPPVERDETAERAAQIHVDDMASTGYTAHWGSDGSVPEERYTLAGGRDFVQENAACFADGVRRPLAKDPKFSAADLETIERSFMDEIPPADGHRRNILKDTHTGLGIGLAQPEGIPQPCMAQEFTDQRGTYDDLPEKARLGSSVRIAGEVEEPVEFGGVGLARIEPRRPMPASELNQTSTYPVPKPYALYFPKGFKTPKPVELDGKSFSIELPLSDRGRPGRYQVSIWGGYPGAGNQLVMISLRTIDVR